MSKRYQAAIITATYNGLLVPNAPTIGTATAGAGSASVAFTAPSNVGGGAITSYTAISSPGGIVGTGATSPVTVSGLTNGTAYTFTVVATNAYGSGPASAASNSVTPSLNYIEEVFSTWLYTGSNSATTITNGIDLAGKGGLVWSKGRTGGSADNHLLIDTVRGVNRPLRSNEAGGQYTETTLTAFNSNGYNITGGNGDINLSGRTYVSWTFREQAKFFDVVTYTGTGSAQTIAHNLGSTPGCIIVKKTSGTGDWFTWHRSLVASLGNDAYIFLNDTSAATTFSGVFGVPTSTTFTVGPDASTSASGATYVAYIFAHNAGGFGLTGTDNVISCGSFAVGGGSDGVVTLGYEPQWVMFKQAQVGGSGNWRIVDNMRGCSTTITSGDRILSANLADAEADAGLNMIDFTATGFVVKDGSVQGGNPYIYIAVRRGPMRVPTTGTSVFSPNLSEASIGTAVTTGFPVDLQIVGVRPNYMLSVSNAFMDRLRGVSTTSTEVGNFLAATSTNVEVNNLSLFKTFGWGNTGYNQDSAFYGTGDSIYWNFRRAPGFFDEVCYTGTGSAGLAVSHNLAVAPELIIAKRRTGAIANWPVYSKYLNGGVTPENYYLFLSVADGTQESISAWNNTAPSATTFTVGNAPNINASGGTYVAYLFATCPGVSKVGSFTGTGSTQVINCGFTAGARFVLIKSTSASGAWYVWDSARGIVAGNDPYLTLNTTAAEVTNTDWVDTAATGFELSNAGGNLANSSGVSYIFLAIA